MRLCARKLAWSTVRHDVCTVTEVVGQSEGVSQFMGDRITITPPIGKFAGNHRSAGNLYPATSFRPSLSGGSVRTALTPPSQIGTEDDEVDVRTQIKRPFDLVVYGSFS